MSKLQKVTIDVYDEDGELCESVTGPMDYEDVREKMVEIIKNDGVPVARIRGEVPKSMISAALCGKYNLKEEKWRLICETLALDYDQVVADPESEPQEKAESVSPSENSRGVDAVQQPDEDDDQAEDDDPNEEERNVLAVTARYLAGRLKEDIRKGMNISLEDLHTLLTVCKNMQNAAENNN